MITAVVSSLTFLAGVICGYRYRAQLGKVSEVADKAKDNFR
jgi:hypothetical protein